MSKREVLYKQRSYLENEIDRVFGNVELVNPEIEFYTFMKGKQQTEYYIRIADALGIDYGNIFKHENSDVLVYRYLVYGVYKSLPILSYYKESMPSQVVREILINLLSKSKLPIFDIHNKSIEDIIQQRMRYHEDTCTIPYSFKGRSEYHDMLSGKAFGYTCVNNIHNITQLQDQYDLLYPVLEYGVEALCRDFNPKDEEVAKFKLMLVLPSIYWTLLKTEELGLKRLKCIYAAVMLDVDIFINGIYLKSVREIMFYLYATCKGFNVDPIYKNAELSKWDKINAVLAMLDCCETRVLLENGNSIIQAHLDLAESIAMVDMKKAKPLMRRYCDWIWMKKVKCSKCKRKRDQWYYIYNCKEIEIKIESKGE